jgi:hypothetical protein
LSIREWELKSGIETIMQRHCSIAGRVSDEYNFNILDFSSEHAMASRKEKYVFPLPFLFLIHGRSKS